MYYSSSLLIFFLGILYTDCINAETGNVNAVEKPSNITAVTDQKVGLSAPSDYYTVPSFLPDYWRSGIGQTLAYGGIIISTLAILTGLAWLFTPLFGLKMCQLVGICEKSAITHSSGGNLQDPSLQSNGYSDMQQYVYPGPYNVATYRKRSVNYIGPILKTLASAYEKYEHSSTTKKTD